MKNKLPPGRLLDAVVAETIMGWTWAGDARGSALLVPPGYQGSACTVIPLDEKSEVYAHGSLPHFSTSLTDAWSAQLWSGDPANVAACRRALGTTFMFWFQEQAKDLTCYSGQEVAYVVCLALLEGMSHPAGSLMRLDLHLLDVFAEYGQEGEK